MKIKLFVASIILLASILAFGQVKQTGWTTNSNPVLARAALGVGTNGALDTVVAAGTNMVVQTNGNVFTVSSVIPPTVPTNVTTTSASTPSISNHTLLIPTSPSTLPANQWIPAGGQDRLLFQSLFWSVYKSGISSTNGSLPNHKFVDANDVPEFGIWTGFSESYGDFIVDKTLIASNGIQFADGTTMSTAASGSGNAVTNNQQSVNFGNGSFTNLTANNVSINMPNGDSVTLIGGSGDTILITGGDVIVTNGSLTAAVDLIAPSITLNGDTRTSWPSGGGTNQLVTSGALTPYVPLSYDASSNVVAGASLSSLTVTNGTINGSLTVGGVISGNGSGLTNLSAGSTVTNFTGVTLTPTGTNLTINLAGYTTNNVIDLSFTLNLNTNVYLLAVTNSAPLATKGFSVDVLQAGQFALTYNTNQAPTGAATIMPQVFGQFITVPTNSTKCKLRLYFVVEPEGTNITLIGQSPIVR